MVTQTGKRALVTGAGKRIGSALAKALSREGFDIALHYRSSVAETEATVTEITALGGRAVALGADLMKDAERDQLIADASDGLGGPITLLVNSAAAFVADSVQTHDLRGWDLHMGLNLRTPIRLAQMFDAQLPDEAHGQIINIIDHRIWKLNPTYFTYTLSKSALWTATRTLAQALAPRIRVNAIGPGATLPNDQESRADFDREIITNLLHVWPSPDLLAEAMIYLVRARAVTGQMIAVDGGQHLLWQTPDLPEASREAYPQNIAAIAEPVEDIENLPTVPTSVKHQVIVDQLECEADIGINAEEKGGPQTVCISARLATLNPVADDHIRDTVDYVAVVSLIRTVVDERRRGLAETLAGDIATRLSEMNGVGGVEVRVDKPSALLSVLPGVRALVGATARIGQIS